MRIKWVFIWFSTINFKWQPWLQCISVKFILGILTHDQKENCLQVACGTLEFMKFIHWPWIHKNLITQDETWVNKDISHETRQSISVENIVSIVKESIAITKQCDHVDSFLWPSGYTSTWICSPKTNCQN